MELEVKNKSMALTIKEAVIKNRQAISGCHDIIAEVVERIVNEAIDTPDFMKYLIDEFTKDRALVCVGIVFTYKVSEYKVTTLKATGMGNIIIHYPFNAIRNVTPENFTIITREVLNEVFDIFKTKFGFICEWAGSKRDTIILKLP